MQPANRRRWYQYLGDGILLNWTFPSGMKNNNALRCFFLMRSAIQSKSQHYINEYGCLPEFRAGMNGGKVMVTWVGEMKKEIVYIGETINSAARILEECKRLDRDFLLTENIFEGFSNTAPCRITFVDETVPRGSQSTLRLYSVEEWTEV
jgi:adenylate cyclase